MIVALLIAGIGFLLTGLLGVAYGISIKEFSFGNTMIIAGAVMACTGTIMIALYVVVRELKSVAEHLEMNAAMTPRSAIPAPLARADATPDGRSPMTTTSRSTRWVRQIQPTQNPEPRYPSHPPGTKKPRHGNARARRRRRCPPKPHLRPRSAGICCFPRPRAGNASAPRRADRDFGGWRPARPNRASRSQRLSKTPGRNRNAPVRPMPRRGATAALHRPLPSQMRAPIALYRAAGVRSRRRDGAQIRRGRWHGLYLYSDGSIEAQLPEGMMRFASIDALRAHLDQRA